MKKRILLLLVFLFVLSACEKVDTQLSSTGKKLMPPRPLTDMVLVDDQDKALPIDLLKHHYSYVLLAESSCDDFCQQYIQLTSEAIKQTSLSKPVKQLLVLGYEPDRNWLDKIKQDNPALTVAILTRSIWTIFTIPFIQEADDMLGAPLYLVDPRGFIVLVYDDLNDADPLVSDLKSLDVRP